MTSLDEYDFVVLEVLRGIDFLIQSQDKLENLNYLLNPYDPKSTNFQLVFNRLAEDKIISFSKPWDCSIDGYNKKIGLIIPLSVIDKKKFNSLFLKLSKKYKNDSRKNNSKISITINKRGIYLSLNNKQIYEVGEGRREIIDLLIDGPHRLGTLVEKINQRKTEKYVIDAIAGINERFSKNVVTKIGEKIIISTSQGYILNTDKYDIRTN